MLVLGFRFIFLSTISVSCVFVDTPLIHDFGFDLIVVIDAGRSRICATWTWAYLEHVMLRVNGFFNLYSFLILKVIFNATSIKQFFFSSPYSFDFHKFFQNTWICAGYPAKNTLLEMKANMPVEKHFFLLNPGNLNPVPSFNFPKSLIDTRAHVSA